MRKKFEKNIITLLVTYFKNKVRSLVVKFLYKKSYDYYATIRKVSHGLASIFDFQEIYNFVGDTIFSTLGLKNIYLFSDISNGGYKAVFKKYIDDKSRKIKTEHGNDEEKIKVGQSSDLINFFKTSDDIIVRDEMRGYIGDLNQNVVIRIKSELESFNGEVAVPVFVDNKLTLLLILGEKLSGDIFTNEDVNLLNTISDQTAIAIKNARFYEEKIHTERLASIGMMSATFAHEMRNPLTSLKTFAQLIPEKYDDAEFRNKFSKIVIGEIERINGLIEDLLDFSIKKKSQGINNFDIIMLVNETVDYVKGKLEFENKSVFIEKNYNKDMINMSGNPEKLKHAFINILNNGCQAMNGDGVIKVDICQSDRNVDIAITDTGEGIPAENIAKIFDPFITTKEMGVGLGLAISKRIIEDHGGSLKVKSELSKGTTFTVSLPSENK